DGRGHPGVSVAGVRGSAAGLPSSYAAGGGGTGSIRGNPSPGRPQRPPSAGCPVTSTLVMVVLRLWRPKSERPDERRRSVATRKAVGLLERSDGLPDTFWYQTKRRLLGPPLVNQDLGEQRLSNPLALGGLSPRGLSSSAYGTEEILIALVPFVGLAAFTLILPMTLVVLLVMVLVLLSYREIVMVYIRPGGSYVVARENFGPR